MHIAEVVTIAKSLPLLRLNTYKSLILSYSVDYRRILLKNVAGFKERYNIFFCKRFLISSEYLFYIFLPPSSASPFRLKLLVHQRYRVKVYSGFPSIVLIVRAPGAYCPYTRCLRTVCPIPERYWYVDEKTGITLHPVSLMNKEFKPKR